MRESVDRLILKPLLPLFTRIYNAGYRVGHNDTIDGGYVDIALVDQETYQSDVVIELVEDILGFYNVV